jgi:hypothetical protein
MFRTLEYLVNAGFFDDLPRSLLVRTNEAFRGVAYGERISGLRRGELELRFGQQLEHALDLIGAEPWIRVESGTRENLRAVAGSLSAVVIAVGDNGAVVRKP